MRKSLFLLLLCVSGVSIAASKTTALSTNSAIFTYSSGGDVSNAFVEQVTFRIDFRTEQGKRWLLNASPVSGSIECGLTNNIQTKRLSIPAQQLNRELTSDGRGVRYKLYTGAGTYRSPRINWGASYYGYGNINCWASGIVLEEGTGRIYVDADRDLKLTNEYQTGLIAWIISETGGINADTSRGLLTGKGSITGLTAIDVKTLVVAPTVRLNVGGQREKIGWSSDRGYNVPMNVNISGNLSGLEFTSGSALLTEGGNLNWDSSNDIFVYAKKDAKWIPGENGRVANFTVSFP